MDDEENNVESSDKAVFEISEKLAKLRNIPDTEKTHIALLNSRIDEQSQLIMILKKRHDENVVRCMAAERMNKELEEFRDNAKSDLRTAHRRYEMLENRFQELAENHEQMIVFKDQYKRQNEELRRENERLAEENRKLFNKKIEEQELKIAELSKDVTDSRKLASSLSYEKTVLQSELQRVKATAQRDLDALRNEKADVAAKVRSLEQSLQEATENLKNRSDEEAAHLKGLMKEKENLLDLVMQRSKLVQEKQNEITTLSSKLKATEDSMRKMKQKFEAECEAVNINASVARLRRDLQSAEDKNHDLTMEFEAYKCHTNRLLTSERELNARLRTSLS